MNNIFNQAHVAEHEHSAKKGMGRIMYVICDETVQHKAVQQALDGFLHEVHHIEMTPMYNAGLNAVDEVWCACLYKP